MKLQILTLETCPHCHEAKKFLEKIKPDYPDLVIEEVDLAIPQGQQLAQKFGIMAAPGIVIDGELFSTGGLNKDKLIKKLEGR